MVGDENADVLVLQLPDNLLNIFHGNGIYTGKRLVEHDELGVDGQTAGNLRTAALTTRKLVTLVLAHLLEAELGNQTFQLVLLIIERFVGHLEHGSDVVLHAHLTEDRCLLCQIADARLGTFVYRIVGDVEVIEENTAFVGCNQAHGHVERGGLAGAVRA